MEKNKLVVSRMSGWETAFAIGWLPIHILGLPILLTLLRPGMSGARANFWIYVIGAAVVSLLCVRFLIRDFWQLFQKPVLILGQAMLCFALMLAANVLLSYALTPFLPEENPNNQALMNLAKQDWLRIAFISVAMAPLLEELMFRGGVFGLIRRWNRPAAYLVCVLLFAVYHTWQYALEDSVYWLYTLQYLPAGFLLCYAYDRNECIWASILMHMVNNGFTLAVMQLREIVL